MRDVHHAVGALLLSPQESSHHHGMRDMPGFCLVRGSLVGAASVGLSQLSWPVWLLVQQGEPAAELVD